MGTSSHPSNQKHAVFNGKRTNAPDTTVDYINLEVEFINSNSIVLVTSKFYTPGTVNNLSETVSGIQCTLW